MPQAITTVIFDMDGVLADTQRLHADAEHEVLKRRGIHLHPDDITHRFSGVSGQDMFREIFDEHEHDGDVLEIIAEKRAIMAKHRDTIMAIPGIPDVVPALKAAGFRLGVASASGPEFINRVLQHINVHHHFDAFTSSREVQFGKPAPDFFLLAAKKLNANPAECVVIEDALHGMTGAKAAGMYCIGFIQNHLHRTGVHYPADHIISAMTELTPDMIHHLSTRVDA